MTTEHTTPIDDHEVFNLVIHAALRRDLERLADQAYQVLWVLDDLDDDRAARVRGLLPTPVLWLMRLIGGRRYASTTRRAWGTPS